MLWIYNNVAFFALLFICIYTYSLYYMFYILIVTLTEIKEIQNVSYNMCVKKKQDINSPQ